MKLAKGPRPWSIWAFSILVLAQGLWHLTAEFAELYQWTSMLDTITKQVRAEVDRTIITASARFTIVCIPVVAVWAFASKIAKWLITITASYLILSKAYSAMSIAKSFGLVPYFEYNWDSLITPIALGLASALLFTQPSVLWLQKKKDDHAAVFD
jgi:hypothetical protein